MPCLKLLSNGKHFPPPCWGIIVSWQPYTKSKAQGPSRAKCLCSQPHFLSPSSKLYTSWGSNCPLGCIWNLKHFLESALASNKIALTWVTLSCRNALRLYLHKHSRGGGVRCQHHAAAVGFMGSSSSGKAETGKSLECPGHQHILVGGQNAWPAIVKTWDWICRTHGKNWIHGMCL